MSTLNIETESKPAEYAPGFDEEAFNRLDARGEPAALRAKREAAFQVYRAIPNPRPTDEEWRRTSPALFPFERFRPAPALKPVPAAAGHPWAAHFDVAVSIDDHGFHVRDVSGALERGQVYVGPLAEAAERHPELIRRFHLGPAMPEEMGKYLALNNAFWNVGLFIHIPDQVELEKGILLHYHLSGARAAWVPRLLVVAGRQSRAAILEQFASPDAAALLAVTGKEMYVGEGARLRVISSQEWGGQSLVIANDWARVERDGQIDWITLNFGSRVSKMKFGSDVAGPGAAAELDGIYFTAADQHLDQKTFQIHSSRDTYSRLLYKGAVKDKSHSVYQGLIQAKPGAIKVDAYQTNNNLVLSDGARADTIPGLLIDADDLKCSHGATIGNLDPQQLFYLRSRGLPEAEARKIVILGFFEEVVQRIPYEFLRERVHERIEGKL
jgi:Fe-S cluster assembly protein SufD